MPNDKIDLSIGTQGRAILDHLAGYYGGNKAEAARQAFLLLLQQHAGYRDLVAEAVQALAAALEPDGRYDPADDPREVEVVERLATLLGSTAAAQGVRQALVMMRMEMTQ